MPNVVIVRNTYPDEKALKNVLKYVLDKAVAVGGYGVYPNMDAAYLQMKFVKEAFYQTDALQLKHFFITLDHSETTYIDDAELLQLGFVAGQVFQEYQMVYGIHYDGSHIHLHLVMNTTSFLDGHQYSDGITMFNRLCETLKTLYSEDVEPTEQSKEACEYQ
ncbi:MAG: relaxase/mobilization nuclease domain-containing protein [Lachnospiraceae bacterium]|nr:relaxase/mobilization nuclease domain-containing protein [Lachnospiraceae bacterium]